MRCDTSLVGSPCTNCRLDDHVCTLRNSSARRPKKRIQALSTASPLVPSAALVSSVPVAAEAPPELHPWGTNVEKDDNISLSRSPASNLVLDSSYGLFPGQNSSCLPTEEHLSPFISRPFTIPPVLNSFSPFTQELAFNTSVTFSYYRFLEVKELAKLVPGDVRYLESKGCLHVPSRPHLDQFIRHYFLYVHPCTPILDEGHFWDIYLSLRGNKNETETISLLLFQAMLFAATSFVPLDVIRACGFRNYYMAREVFHERARLLYNFRTETDSATIAQASLLLSFQSTPHEQQDNTSWLSTAIQYARADGAHLYYCLPGQTSRQTREKKRLWWCCVLRDRVIALGVRRPVQITPDHFDFSQTGVTELDFAGEVERSQVYDTDTKSFLARIFIVQCQFAVAVTSMIMVIYPLNGVVIPDLSTRTPPSKLHNCIEESQKELGKWMEMARAQLVLGPDDTATPHKSVTLYTNLTYIYYFSAQIARCHYAMYILNKRQAFITDYTQQLKMTQTELKRGIINVTSNITNLVTLELIGHLPISVVAYTALPLALLSLDVRFSTTQPQKTRRQHRLDAYVETMKQCRHRFDFVCVVFGVVSKLLHLVDFSQRTTCPSNNAADVNLGMTKTSTSSDADANFRISRTLSARPRSWVDLVSTEPQLYFRLSASLDFALSKGKYPSESELPGWIIDLSPPHAPAEEMELPSSANGVLTMSPEDPTMGSRPLVLEAVYNRSQRCHLDKLTSSPPPTAPRGDRNETDFLDGGIFELGSSTETGSLFDGMDEIVEHNENDDDESPFRFNMVSYLLNMPALGG